MRRAGTGLVALAAALALATAAGADSFDPVTLTTTIAPVARLHAPLAVTVKVSTDAGALDDTEGPVRIAVKLADECGGTFETTPGVTLLNAQLSPQPTRGRAYTATAHGSGRPTAYGVQTVCVFLEDTDVDRVWAHDESDTVDVAPACTADANRLDSAEAAVSRAERRLRRTKRAGARRRLRTTIASDKRTAARDRTRARAACGSGVPL